MKHCKKFSTELWFSNFWSLYSWHRANRSFNKEKWETDSNEELSNSLLFGSPLLSLLFFNGCSSSFSPTVSSRKSVKGMFEPIVSIKQALSANFKHKPEVWTSYPAGSCCYIIFESMCVLPWLKSPSKPTIIQSSANFF